MFERREFLKQLGLGGGALALGQAPTDDFAGYAEPAANLARQAQTLYEEISTYPFDDTHCHPLTDADAETTPDLFLQRLALAAFPVHRYFPSGVYRQWTEGDARTRNELDRRHNIEATLAEITFHVRESIFVKYMVKEMAEYLECPANLSDVIEARNERGRDYWRYVNSLFRDVGLENAMLDTGYSEGMDADGIARFEMAVEPMKGRRIYRVETIERELLQQDISFDELESRFVAMVRRGLDQDGNFGKSSYGMKSYLMPRIGVVKPLYDSSVARTSWENVKASRDVEARAREERAHRGRDLSRYLLTLALEECLARDMPMQFHAGDGEAPGIILRQQDPYFLEEVVRFAKDGMMRMPKIIPIHAGYPLVAKAAWLSHLYTNCYFELSLMTPLIHQGLFYRYMEVMEAVPLSKILFGSDAYHLPELYWLTGRWGKRYLSQALAVYVESGSLTRDEALEAARMILYRNNRRVYNLSD